MSKTIEVSELDADLWEVFKSGDAWVSHDEYMRLKAENAKLREYAHKLELENIRLDSDNCDLRGEMEPIWAENEKLRTLLGGKSIVIDYWKDEDGTMHVLTTDGEQIYEFEIRAAWHRPPTEKMYERFAETARELGIEVDDGQQRDV